MTPPTWLRPVSGKNRHAFRPGDTFTDETHTVHDLAVCGYVALVHIKPDLDASRCPTCQHRVDKGLPRMAAKVRA